MRIFLFLLLVTLASNSAFAESEAKYEGVPDYARFYTVHNGTTNSTLKINCNEWTYYVPPGTTREIYVPSGYSSYLVPGTFYNWNLESWHPHHPKASHVHFYVLQIDPASGYGYTMFAKSEMLPVDRFDSFAQGISLGLVIAVGIAGIRYGRRAFAVSTE